ncbi:MAG: hypothetical protein U5K69_11845 [Balneolaceae bacterium]|nr:hypothetical protein [Balneolaceae bacterium]
MNFPTRNTARYLARDIFNTCSDSQIPDYTARDLFAYFILWYNRKNDNSGQFSIQPLIFVFTNGLIDMIPRMDVSYESYIHSVCTTRDGMGISEIEDKFKSLLGLSPSYFLERADDNRYKIQITQSGPKSLDLNWFNNANNYIRPLLSSYKKLKENRNMAFQREDVIQIPIDYSLAMSYNHFNQIGALTKEICNEISKIFTTATNESVPGANISHEELIETVYKDIKALLSEHFLIKGTNLWLEPYRAYFTGQTPNKNYPNFSCCWPLSGGL